MVGVCLIGVAIYASMNMDDGSGMVSSIRRASLAALQPMRGATLAHDGQSANGQKEDRIQMTAAGFVTRHVIHDTVIERQGSREFITIKPYLRIVAGLATDLPDDADKLPPFNPFKLYSDYDAGRRRRRRRSRRAASGQRQSRRPPRRASAASRRRSSSAPTRSTRSSPRRPRISPMPTDHTADGPGDAAARVLSARKRASASHRPRSTPPMIHKSAEDADTGDDDDDIDDDLIASGDAEGRSPSASGDTLMSLFAKVDTEPSEAQAIIERSRPDLPVDDLKAGEEVRFTLVPAPSRHRRDGAGQECRSTLKAATTSPA